MSNFSDNSRLEGYLVHIADAIDRIQFYTDTMDENEFLTDEKTQDAVVRNFEVMGEAARNIERHYPEYAAKHASLPWRSMYEMRNALAHGYFKIDFEIVWRTIQLDLPEMELQIKNLLQSR